ncbi:hypothetical protein ACGP04_00710 [Piscirickettsia salmonis]|uniref:hypothetical protein n=1 Tax=Piscirickettsia salmonis TaxID=1238 RepID=UPI0011CECAE4
MSQKENELRKLLDSPPQKNYKLNKHYYTELNNSFTENSKSSPTDLKPSSYDDFDLFHSYMAKQASTDLEKEDEPSSCCTIL